MCDRWNYFPYFLEDMGERPEGTTLDRIDGNGDYEPGNCRWVTAKQQSQNRDYVRLAATKAEEARRLVASGMKQKDAAKLLGVSRSRVCVYMKGK